MISDNVTDEMIPCKPVESCLLLGSFFESACPASGKHKCFRVAEATRLRAKYSRSVENQTIVSHVDLVVTDAINKVSKRPDDAEAYLRTMSRNREKDLVKNDRRAKDIYDAAHDEGPLAEYRRLVSEDSGVENADAIERRDVVAYVARLLPDERSGYILSSRELFVLMLSGYKPRDFVAAYPELTPRELRHHRDEISEATRRAEG